jgi:hypothetical protein
MFTPEAKAYVKEYAETLDRETIVSALEGIGIVCYHCEETEELAAAYADSVESGDIEFGRSFMAAKNSSYQAYMAWFDIEDWEC